jgi:hypothetical protein
MSRTYIIPDLHGEFDKLVRAMEAISADARKRCANGIDHRVVVLGDYGSLAAEYLRKEQSRATSAPVFWLPTGQIDTLVFDDDFIAGEKL